MATNAKDNGPSSGNEKHNTASNIDIGAALLAAAQELQCRLAVWHIDGDIGPIQTLSVARRLEMEGRRFRQVISQETQKPPNVIGYRILELEGRELQELRERTGNHELGGIAPDVLTTDFDRSTTQRWMGYFWWLVDQVPPSPDKDYLTVVWEQLLDSRAWAGRRADPVFYSTEHPYQLTGFPVEISLLQQLVDAADCVFRSRQSQGTGGKRPGGRRTSRVVAIDALTKAMKDHLRAAHSHACQSLQDTGEPKLLPRPEKKLLGKMVGCSKTKVTNCFGDAAAGELRTLYEIAADLERVMALKPSKWR